MSAEYAKQCHTNWGPKCASRLSRVPVRGSGSLRSVLAEVCTRERDHKIVPLILIGLFRLLAQSWCRNELPVRVQSRPLRVRRCKAAVVHTVAQEQTNRHSADGARAASKSEQQLRLQCKLCTHCSGTTTHTQ